MNHLLQKLRDKGNTVLVVEHKPEAMAIADHIVDMGPGAGIHGGQVVYTGDLAGLRVAGTRTGTHLEQRQTLKTHTRVPQGWLPIRDASVQIFVTSMSTSHSASSSPSLESPAQERVH